MIIFIACLIPILTAGVLWYFFRHKTLWWEFLIPFAASILIGLIFKFAGEYSQTRDTEYWSGIIQTAEHYEDWNERVPCRHPKYCTRTVSDGKGGTKTETYQCGYYHPYDVDYHPEYWQVNDDNGLSCHVSHNVYNKLVNKFGNKKFVDLGRHYHSNDGDKYVASWPKTDETIECMVTSHTYENRVQASTDIHNFPEVTEDEVKMYKLYEYPKIHSYYKQTNLLGSIDGSKRFDRKLELLNAKLGRKKQVKVFVLLFNTPDREAGMKQEAYWKGGNKNEVVVCIGLDKDKNVDWCYPFSWTESEIVMVDIRTHIEEAEGKLNLDESIDYIYKEVESNFVRKQFADFDYITVPPTTSQLVWTLIITLLINVGLSFWLVKNEFNEDNPRGNRGYKFSRRRWRF